MAAAALQQLADELAVARTQITQLSTAQDELRSQAQAAIAASEARSAALIQQMNAGGAGHSGASERIELVDFKVNKPENFHGRREESWKSWSRQFKVYCNVRKEGFKKALEWAEAYEGDMLNEHTIDQMQWPSARLADAKLYDFLFLQCRGDALVLVEHYEGMGFEAWRQLSKRYSPSGGQYELDMMGRLMNPQKAAKIGDLPTAILKFERDIRTYESRTGKRFPEEWKTPTFLRILPDSHREELVRRFQLGMKDYNTLVRDVRGFSQEAWFAGKGPSDMDIDLAERRDPDSSGLAVQKWTREASWDDMASYWEQQHQDEELDYMGQRRTGGRPATGQGA